MYGKILEELALHRALLEKQNELLEKQNELLSVMDFGDDVYEGMQNIMTYGVSK